MKRAGVRGEIELEWEVGRDKVGILLSCSKSPAFESAV